MDSQLHFMQPTPERENQSFEDVQFSVQLARELPINATAQSEVLLYRRQDLDEFQEWLYESVDYDVIELSTVFDIQHQPFLGPEGRRQKTDRR